MKLSQRLLLAPLVAIGFLVASGVIAHVALREITSQFDALRENNLRAAQDLGAIKLRMALLSSRLYRTMSLGDSLSPERIAADARALSEEGKALKADVLALTPRLPADARPTMEGLPAMLDKYQVRASQALTMAESAPGSGVLMLTSAAKLSDEAFALVGKAESAVQADVQAMSATVMSRSQRASVWLAVMVLLAAVGSMAVTWWTSRQIVRRVNRAVEASERMAAGDVRPFEAGEARDEVGRLLASIAQCATRLQGSVRAIQEASSTIGVAAAEIANGSMDLSQRTEHTASSLQNTKSAMAEMGGLVSLGSQSAAEARTLVESASGLARSGGQVVADVVATMSEINTRSRQIADITSVIDGIAFQTNILALNAAVEAARAGEQGRGFAVVASEVRALAQRSAAAAREIKDLIGGSVHQVEQGSVLVDQAGRTMQDIVAAVRQVETMIGDVAGLSDRQDSGVHHMNDALDRFDRMTQENAALAEQSAAASESLRLQATRLAEVTAQFRVAQA